MIGSLFSGIGGLELGLEWAGLGPVLWQVEKSEACRAVLEAHWPESIRYEDIRHVSFYDLDKASIICGGFPCQDVSQAGGGDRPGLSGSRSGLWFEFLRAVGEMLPRWVVVENVKSGASRWVDTVLSGLEGRGYDCLPVPLSAADVAAPQIRERIFILARNTDGYGEPVGAVDAEASGVPRDHEGLPSWPDPPRVGVADGVPGRMVQCRMLGNSVAPRCAQVVGEVLLEIERRSAL